MLRRDEQTPRGKCQLAAALCSLKHNRRVQYFTQHYGSTVLFAARSHRAPAANPSFRGLLYHRYFPSWRLVFCTQPSGHGLHLQPGSSRHAREVRAGGSSGVEGMNDERSLPEPRWAQPFGQAWLESRASSLALQIFFSQLDKQNFCCCCFSFVVFFLLRQ